MRLGYSRYCTVWAFVQQWWYSELMCNRMNRTCQGERTLIWYKLSLDHLVAIQRTSTGMVQQCNLLVMHFSNIFLVSWPTVHIKAGTFLTKLLRDKRCNMPFFTAMCTIFQWNNKMMPLWLYKAASDVFNSHTSYTKTVWYATTWTIAVKTTVQNIYIILNTRRNWGMHCVNTELHFQLLAYSSYRHWHPCKPHVIRT